MVPKILLYDIETSPIISYNWGIYEQNAVAIKEDWQILCFAYKWLDDKKTHVVAQPDFKHYKKGINDDYYVVKRLHELFNEADVVIAHNGNQFDQRKAHARMIVHGMEPSNSYEQIDTKLVAKRYAGFTSNKLDDLGELLGVGKKLETGGFKTWLGCLAGDKRAWEKMKKYNKQDVVLLEKVYLRLRGWIKNHPAINVLSERPDSCPKCGLHIMHKVMKYRATSGNLYQYYRCQNCGGMAKSRIPETKSKMHYVN